MPLAGFRCPEHVPTAGATQAFEHCIHKCPHQCQPVFVLKRIADRETANEHKGSMLSPTALSSCPRKLKLTRTVDYYATPQSFYDVTRGALIHGFVERIDLPGVVQEQRLFKSVPLPDGSSYVFSGRLDYYDTVRQRLEDLKTMTEKGLYTLYRTGAKEEHIWQVNLYRWLMWGGHLGAPDGPQVFWPVQELQVHYCLMNRVISTGKRYVDRITARKTKAEINYGRPWPLEVKREEIGAGRYSGSTIWDVTFEIPPVPMYPFDQIEQYLAAHAPVRAQSFRDPSFIPDGVMADDDRNWECGYCAVRPECRAIEEAHAALTVADPPKAQNVAAPPSENVEGPFEV